MIFILKVLITFLILFMFYWLVIEWLWEEDKISDEWHEIVQKAGYSSLAALMVGAIASIGIFLIVLIWKGL